MSPSRLWPWPGLPWLPGAECVWMDTFPGCSLIDASVDARGLMHSHSLLALPANPACRLFPLSHRRRVGLLHKVWCHEVMLKRFKGCLHPTGPLRGKNYVRQEVRSEAKLSSWSDHRSQVDNISFSFFLSFYLLNFCPRSVSVEPGLVFSIIQLSMWVVATSSAAEGKVQGGH